MTIAHLAYRIAHEFKGGVVGLASLMGRGDKVLASKLNPNTPTHHLNIDELEMMGDFTDTNLQIAQYFADKCNAIVFKLPNVSDQSDMCLLDSYMQIMKEMGDLAAEFQKAYADGSIDRKEFTRIANEVTGVQARLLAFQSTVESKVT